ncbi:hypothetical protein CVT24_008666 [Panaeolus cyanescens]|uniref:XPG-I domain-containing protein n=1 Tax=Panaeolus cyanescens TaxID=181874 RepID=A0A409WTP0_9AGAR|nr:hypothetical protein CVT24_008666 [Panaeolus cyanescens]
MSPVQRMGPRGHRASRFKKQQASSPLKREIVDTPNTSLLQGALYTMSTDDILQDEIPFNFDIPPSSSLTTPSSSSLAAQEKQLNALTDRVHTEALQRDEEYRADRALHGTERSYPRHFKNYVAWWEEDQLSQKAEWDKQCKEEADAQAEQRREAGIPEPSDLPPLEPFPYTPAEPITATKACLFLHYELSREKRGPGGKTSLPNTTVGKSSIKQTINSLEYYRFKRSRLPEYLAVPESQTKLREDPRICTIERSSQTSEAKRQETSQEMKAKATFTTDELVLMSKDYLLNPIGTSKRMSTVVALRNRTMLMFSTSMAFRGDNTRRVLLSDLNIEEVPMPDREGADMDRRVKALVVMSNQGKTNTTGRIDKHYAFRHRNVHLCPVSALAFYLFSLWHVFGRSPPNFVPSYTDKRASGDHGYRAWYSTLLFPPLRSATSDDTVPMSYENHRKQCNDQKEHLNLSHHASTHGGRSYTATTAIALGASTDSVRALGNWSFSGSWSLYNHSLPIDAMVAAAGCNGHQIDSYFVLRECIVPPNELLSSLFPWVDIEEAAYNSRILQKKEAKDGALRYLLNLLLYLRLVLAQDAAILYQESPNAPIFEYAPFNTDLFRSFAQSTVSNIREAKEHRRQYLQNLPATMQESFRGTLESSRLQALEYQRRIEESHHNMSASFGAMCGLMHTTIQVISAFTEHGTDGTSSSSRGKRKASTVPSASMADLQRAARDIVASQATKRVRYDSPASQLAHTSTGTGTPGTVGVAAVPNHPSRSVSNTSLAGIPPTLDSAVTNVGQTVNPSALLTPAMTVSEAPPIPVASGLGTTYSDRAFPVLRSDPDVFGRQIKALTDLEHRFGSGKLKEHVFEWRNDEWIPKDISLWKPPLCSTGEQILEMVWADFKDGIDGKFSLDQLAEHWGTRWRTNNSTIKTELSRRSKIVNLIRLLSDLPNWDNARAFQFLRETHPFHAKPRLEKCKAHKDRATFVFVFDGPNRPAIKRDCQVRQNLWWNDVVRGMIHMFGFRAHNAPGEAEAELAVLNHLGFIDAVFTTDSDTLVFGAQTVIKIITERGSRWNDEVEVFTSARIESEAHLSPGGLILFALLTGGDYDPSGLVNCGQVTALALCRCGFGDQLLDAARADTPILRSALK